MHGTVERASQFPSHLGTWEVLRGCFESCNRMKNQLRLFERSLMALESRHEAEERRPPFELTPAVDCLICLENIPNPQSHRLICGHAFHRECLHEFFKSRGGNFVPCPVCRFSLEATDLMNGSNPDSRFESTRDAWQACVQPMARIRAAMEGAASWVSGVLEYCRRHHPSRSRAAPNRQFSQAFLRGLSRSPFPELISAYRSVIESVATYRALRLGKNEAEVAAFVQQILQ